MNDHSNISFFGKTDTGNERPENQDVFIIRPELNLCLVADGMGGEAGGELASRIFSETALEIFFEADNQSEDETIRMVQDTFHLANEKIRDHVDKNPHHEGMGCTAELAVFSSEGMVIGHIGDSRTYCLRDGRLHQLSNDHSLVQQQVDMKLISPEEARISPHRNVILRAVGIDENISVDLIKGRTFSGDLFLFCSDGLTDMVEDISVREILALETGLSQKAEKLVEMAKSSGGKDNITVVLSEITK